MQKNNYSIISFILIALVLFSRLIPHQPNFTPLIPVVLFSSMMFKGKRYILIPILALFLSDVLLQYYGGYQYLFSSTFFWTYSSLFLVFLFSYFYNNKMTSRNVFINSFAGAVIFFLVSNFGVWISSSGFYPFNLSGLIACYTAAIPFFRNTLSSTVIYSAILFIPFLLKNKALISENILSKNN